MQNVKALFASNLKRIRRRKDLSQEKLAEKAGITAHYISLIEIARNFPKSEVIERLAAALEIQVHELFIIPNTPSEEQEKLHNFIKQTVSDAVAVSVENAFSKMLNSEKEKK